MAKHQLVLSSSPTGPEDIIYVVVEGNCSNVRHPNCIRSQSLWFLKALLHFVCLYEATLYFHNTMEHMTVVLS